MKIRRSNERGSTNIGWLKSKHSFSFGDYYDRANMGYRSLRVINDDIIEAAGGFDTHGHRDMEIISIVVEGALEHRDSMGNGETLRPGEVQVMTAGSGIRHSEFNPSPTERTHLIQIWILPEKIGLTPSYAQRAFDTASRTNKLQRVAGTKQVSDDGALKINQDANIYLVRIEPGNSVKHSVPSDRGAWVHLISGHGTVNNAEVSSGDAASIDGEAQIVLSSKDEASEFILFDLK